MTDEERLPPDLEALVDQAVASLREDNQALLDFAARMIEQTGDDFVASYPDRDAKSFDSGDVKAWLLAHADLVRRGEIRIFRPADPDVEPMNIDARLGRITPEIVEQAARRVHTQSTIDIAVAAGRPITAWLLRRMLRKL